MKKKCVSRKSKPTRTLRQSNVQHETRGKNLIEKKEIRKFLIGLWNTRCEMCHLHIVKMTLSPTAGCSVLSHSDSKQMKFNNKLSLSIGSFEEKPRRGFATVSRNI